MNKKFRLFPFEQSGKRQEVHTDWGVQMRRVAMPAEVRFEVFECNWVEFETPDWENLGRISEKFSETSFQFSRLLLETSFSRRAMITDGSRTSA